MILAAGAEAVKSEFVVGDGETTRQRDPFENRDRAFGREFEHSLAGLAAEMMVVSTTGYLIAGAFPRQVNGRDLPLLFKGVQVAVHRCETQPRLFLGGVLEHLLRGQGAWCRFENMEDGSPL
jgi:hypothetical protein